MCVDTQPSQSLVPPDLLVVEIGNSHVALATMAGTEVRTLARLNQDELSELSDATEAAWESLPDEATRGVAIGSVVPETLQRVLAVVHASLHVEPGIVGRNVRLPLSVAVAQPETIGVDRVCAAAAAYERFASACAVASFGTATTIDCVNDEGVFMGGAILPGLSMQARALHEQTALLPLITPHATPDGSVYGGTTEEAINHGIVLGSIGALREIVERYATDLHRWPRLIVTGGSGRLIADVCDFVDAVEPNLCIQGIAAAYRQQSSAASDG